MMDEARYNGLVAGLWKRILAAVDEVDPDVLDAVATGDMVTLTSASGEKVVINTQRAVRQIWVAGGIGIAPFLGWVSGADGHVLPRADLFYCTPTAADAPFLPELTAAARRQPALRLHPVHSRGDGRLTVKKIQAAAGPLTPDTHVFLCGPAAMVEDLSISLRRHGIPRDHVHAEHFAFR